MNNYLFGIVKLELVMVRIKVSNSVPSKYSSQGTPFGSNSGIYTDIINELKQGENDIEEVHLTLYLFNNRHLYDELLELAKKGVRIIVTSLPLTGYDRRKIKDAKDVYSRIIKDDLIDLLIFPHMYVWYGAEYAGGGAAYSFHIKAGIIKYRNGRKKVFLTSGNLTPGDPTHSETVAFVDETRGYSFSQAFQAFFSEVEGRAKPFKEYNELVQELSPELQQIFDFSFVGSINITNFNTTQFSHAFFTAPWITVAGKGSNHYARERLVEVILSAKQRLLVCAQHSHDISPFNGYPGQTMISSITKAKRDNPAMDVRVLKQVSSSGLADKRRAAFVEGHLYHAGIPQKVNKLVHDKFVVADNTVVITTSNFTATQFGWGERRMEYKTGTSNLKVVQEVIDSAKGFFKTPEGCVSARMTRPRKGSPRVKVFKKDVFSEVNAFIVIENSAVADQVAKHFDGLWGHSLSGDVEIPT